jgi:hypothetical protein
MKTTIMEVPQGNAPPESSPEVMVNKSAIPTNSKRSFLFMVLCGLLLTGVLVALVPDWDDNEDAKQKELTPYFKVFESSLPIFSGKCTHTFIMCILICVIMEEARTGSFLFVSSTMTSPTVCYSRSLYPSIHPSIYIANITKGYNSTEDLQQDLMQFAFLTLNQEINGFSGGSGGGCNNYYPGIGVPVMDDMMNKDEGASTGSDGAAGGPTNIFDGVDAFETNNQEENMDTADQTKSDGTYIYASYADTLVVWNATEGKILSKVQMPKIDYTQSTGTTGGGEATNGDMPPDYFYYEPKPYIEAILLEGDKLSLIVSGYGAEYDSERTEASVICNYMGTRIMIYDTNDGYPELLSQTDVHGSFRQAYSTQKNGHVVTQASIDTWTHLQEPIQRWKFPELTDEEYRDEALKIAQELVPKFVTSLTEILDPIDITRLSLFVDSITSQETLDGIMSQLKVADTISMVASFVIDDDDSTTSSNVLDVSVGGTLQPGYWGYVYANDQMIILADKGWQWVEAMQEYAEMTFLVGFRLDGASSKHEIIGSVFGSPLNPYSIDLVEKDNMVYLRIATTINFWSGLVFTDGDEVTVDSFGPSDSSVPNPGDEESTTWNEIVVLGTDSGSGTQLEKLSSVRLGKPDEVRLIIRWLSTGYCLLVTHLSN